MAGPKLIPEKNKDGKIVAGAVQAIERKKTMDFKVPKPRIRRKKVLDEDNYIRTMEHIIRRDYFPDLHAAEEAKRKASGIGTPSVLGTPGVVTPGGIGTPGMTPRSVVTGVTEPPTPLSQIKGTSFEEDTPITTSQQDLRDPIDALRPTTDGPDDSLSVNSGTVVSSITNKMISKKRAKDLRLGQFVATHTSEDNASFQEILAKDRVKQRKKYWWLKEKDAQGDKMLIKGCGDSSSTGRVKFWGYTNKNALMYVPDGVSSSSSSGKPDKNFKAPKETITANTRFPGSMETQIMQEFVEATRTPAHVISGTHPGDGTPVVRGYKLMRTPSPSPNQAGQGSPIVTWGNVASTPLHIREEDPMDKIHDVDVRAKESEFRLPQMPMREQLGLKLGDQAKKKRQKRKKMGTPSRTPVSTPQGHRMVDLSPAAILLLKSQQKKHGKRLRSDSQLRASYKSPLIRSGRRRPGSSLTNSSGSRRKSTSSTLLTGVTDATPRRV